MASILTTALTKEQLKEEFRAGVTATLRSWSALRTAVDAGWGGGQSQEKAETLRQSIYEHLDGNTYPPTMDILDLEDALAIYIEEEFSVTLEDNSEKQVADVLFRMYHDCFKNQDPTLCREVVATATKATALLAQHPVQIQTNEFDDEDDEMEDVEDGEDLPSATSSSQQVSEAQLYASESLFGGPIMPKKPPTPAEPPRQLGEEPPKMMEPEVDEEGFAPIVKKKNKKKTPMM